MSTYLPFKVAAIALVGFSSLAAGPSLQGGVGPRKLTGPSDMSMALLKLTNSSASKAFTPVSTAKTPIYTYTVELTQTSAFTTYVSIHDSNNKLGHSPTTLAIPPNTLTGTFYAWPISAGQTDLEVYNANGTAPAIHVTIEP